MTINQGIKPRILCISELVIIIGLACVPLFVSFPYRVNIFLSWEGAYRISEGQLPFRDFGTPLGGMYWVIPGIFFKLFGTQLITLVKAQVFINIISGLAFRSIIKSLGLSAGFRIVAVLLFCVSYSFFNFWPWYNHTVIVYEFIGLAFLLKGISGNYQRFKKVIFLLLASFFTVCSFLTKQDAGAMAFILALMLVGYQLLANRDWKSIAIYISGFVVILALFILPFTQYDFGYWFNHGQAPHSARISLMEIAFEFLEYTQWIKFYLFVIVLILFFRFHSFSEVWKNKEEMLFLLLTVGILGQAAVFQVTSYTPPDNNIFFHAFAIAYILYQLAALAPYAAKKNLFPIVLSMGVLLWWSGVFWKYIQRLAHNFMPEETATISSAGENLVNRKTYMIRPVDSSEVEMTKWVYSGLKSFEKISMPPSTVEGINRLMKMDIVKNGKELRVLNMTELTPLAVEIPYKLEKGSHYPLWNHLGVAMFNKQAEMFENRIVNKEYDIVLFEYIPTLNNFYPFRVRESLISHYQKVDSFMAPRRGDTKGIIEVFVKPVFQP